MSQAAAYATDRTAGTAGTGTKGYYYRTVRQVPNGTTTRPRVRFGRPLWRRTEADWQPQPAHCSKAHADSDAQLYIGTESGRRAQMEQTRATAVGADGRAYVRALCAVLVREAAVPAERVAPVGTARAGSAASGCTKTGWPAGKTAPARAPRIRPDQTRQGASCALGSLAVKSSRRPYSRASVGGAMARAEKSAGFLRSVRAAVEASGSGSTV